MKVNHQSEKFGQWMLPPTSYTNCPPECPSAKGHICSSIGPCAEISSLNTENDVGDVDNDNDAVGVALRRENHQAATCNGKMLLNKVEYIDKISDNFCDRNVQFSMFSHGFSHGFPA
jgi:hypothetical protein